MRPAAYAIAVAVASAVAEITVASNAASSVN